MPTATKFSRFVTYHEGHPPIKLMTLLSNGLSRSCDKLKTLYIFNSRVTMATKLGRVITYRDNLLPVTYHNKQFDHKALQSSVTN